MFVRQFVVDGLGHLSTLIADESAGVAAVVDPRRDVDAYLATAAERELRITHVLETHLHNDYVSGARELAAATGAQHVIGSGADLAQPFLGVRHGDVLDIGELRFTALETPGHTPEHVAYAVADTSRADEPILLFTGGSLLVGSVGRTDLLGAENAIPYAAALYRSIHEVILAHEDFVGVYPTHGPGSLCSTGISSSPSSTIGFERRHNPMLQPTDVDAFAHRLLARQPVFPRYFARMRPLNQAGPAILGGVPAPRPLSLGKVRHLLVRDGIVVDARTPAAHAAGHIPGSLSIPAGSSFGTWLGWVVDPDQPLLLLLERHQDWDDLLRQAMRIGFEGAIAGFIQGGSRRWAEGGGLVESGGAMTTDELARRVASDDRAPLIVDVRQASEYAHGHVPGALHIDGGRLPEMLDRLPVDRPIATICASGYRASVAASLLRRAGFRDVSWVMGGLPTWEATGHPVERAEAENAAPAPAPEATHAH